jgi:XTP/dITP diphosphohydrolase
LPKYIKTHSTSEFKLKSPREDGLTFKKTLKLKLQMKKMRLINNQMISKRKLKK